MDSASTAVRPRRAARPAMPSGRLELHPPPALKAHDTATTPLLTAIPMLGSIGVIILVSTTTGGGVGRALVSAGGVLAATLGLVLVQLDRQRRHRRQQVDGARTAYLRYLAGVRQVIRDAADQQRRASNWLHPDPTALPALVREGSGVWERAPDEEEFLQVRYAVCQRPLALELVAPPSSPLEQADPAAASALAGLLAAHGTQRDLPATLDLRALDRVEVSGDPDRARALVRAVICSAATAHSPWWLRVAVVASPSVWVHWEWLKWLPHAASPGRHDGAGAARLVSASAAGLVDLLPAATGPPRHSPEPHLLIVADLAETPSGDHAAWFAGQDGVTVLDLAGEGGGPESPALRLRVEAGPLVGGRASTTMLQPGEEPRHAYADQCTSTTAEATARRLAPRRQGSGAEPSGSGDPARALGLAELLGLGDPGAFDPAIAWRPRPDRDRLRVPIGVDPDGAVVRLDLKEAADQGMGPHGLVIGATGSGKSELLRTLVLGLAMTHSPERLNLVLVDFKGGATFAGMSSLPHVSALITNLAHDVTLVSRMHDALAGEMVRRQELLRAAGSVASIADYETAGGAGESTTALPTLLIVVDEFAELLSAEPELLDLFVAIGRVGRSLGLHLLLASQRLDEGRLHGLESHLSYRIGLRTFSAADSRAVLGVPDAHDLPPLPGLGYLKPDPATLLRFRAACVSARPHGGDRRDPGRAGRPRILPFSLAPVPIEPAAVAPAATQPPSVQESLLDLAVARMADRGRAARQVWLPPLEVPDTLDALLPDLAVDPQLGFRSARWSEKGGLRVPLGTVDRPREQCREVLVADLSGAGGHVAVVGGPRSGKSTLLRTLVAGLSLTTTPLESQLFVLDFGGGTFAPMAGLPHLSGLGTRSEPAVVRRIVAELRGILDRRECYFRAQGIDSIETYRSRHAAGGADDGWGDIFLVVDGWATLRADFEDLEPEVQQLAARGLAFGVHVVAGATRWTDLRATRDLFGTRLELRLGDPSDSEIDRRLAAAVPTGRPGRGVVQARLHFLAALPRVDGEGSPGSLESGIEDLVTRVRNGWPGPDGPKLRLLPSRVRLDSLREQAAPASARQLLLGVDERELAPVSLDPDRDPHLLVFGQGGSGRTSLLRSYLREVTRTRTPAEAQVVLVDYRRSLLGEVPEDFLLHHLTSPTQTTSLLRELASHLEGRLPGPGVTADQLRHRTWWTGAEVFVVVDDYDLVATSQGSPVQALQPLLAQAGDVGLRLVLARRSGGAARALFEPVLQTLRDLAVPGVLLSGSPEEGPLLGGVRPAPMPTGRGRLVTRDAGAEVVQIAWCDPAH